jgi:DNA-binding transcriptional ArsR family regulator
VIRIELSQTDLGRTRLAVSPLWELVASLFWLHDNLPVDEYGPWVARTRSALRGVELGPLDLDIALPKYVPDFAAPIPVDPLPTLADEIEAVRASDPATVRADIAENWGDDPPPPWDAFLGRPREMPELARRLSYAPSTVSAHLDVLARAGLVDRHRVRAASSTASMRRARRSWRSWPTSPRS